MSTNKGFTLIEILIVIVIIGITLGFALIAFGDFGESKRILFSAEQLANTLRLAQQQSILQNQTLGLRIEQRSYQLLSFQNNTHWDSPSNKGIYKLFYFPKNAVIKLKAQTAGYSKTPQIVISPSGDTTPFVLEFLEHNEQTVAILQGHDNSSITLSTSPK